MSMSYNKNISGYKSNRRNELPSDLNKLISSNFITTASTEEYDNILKQLESIETYCRNKTSNIAKIKENIKYVFDKINNKKLTEYGIVNISEEGDINIDLDSYQRKVCEVLLTKVLPEIRSEKTLQQKFLDKLNNIDISKLQEKIDIKKYIKFAKENNLTEEPIEEIIGQYSQYLDNLTNYVNKEKQNNQLIQTFLANPIVRNVLPLSRNNHVCTSACRKDPTGLFCYCDTQPYETFGLTLTKDLCDKC